MAQKWLAFLGDLPPKKVSQFCATRVLFGMTKSMQCSRDSNWQTLTTALLPCAVKLMQAFRYRFEKEKRKKRSKGEYAHIIIEWMAEAQTRSPKLGQSASYHTSFLFVIRTRRSNPLQITSFEAIRLSDNSNEINTRPYYILFRWRR